MIVTAVERASTAALLQAQGKIKSIANIAKIAMENTGLTIY